MQLVQRFYDVDSNDVAVTVGNGPYPLRLFALRLDLLSGTRLAALPALLRGAVCSSLRLRLLRLAPCGLSRPAAY
jgi:hypothetical protein